MTGSSIFSISRCVPQLIGTHTKLYEKIDPIGAKRISPKKVSRLILRNLVSHGKIDIFGTVRRNNGKRLIELRRAESDDNQDILIVDSVEPVRAEGGDLWKDSERGG